MKKDNDNQFATKRDLENVKDGLERAMEKQTKVILKAVDFSINGIKKSLKTEVGGLKTDIANLDKRVVKLEVKADKSLDWQDRISKQLTDLQEENKMGVSSYKRHDDKIENHEKRIINLETGIQAAG